MLLCAAFLFSPPVPHGAIAQKKQESVTSPVIERGKFIVYDLKQPQGEESYEVTRDGDSLVIKSTLELPHMEIKEPLTATLRTRQDLTPERYDIKGRLPSTIEVDTSIEIQGRAATVREGKQVRQLTLPDRFFTLTGYAPLAIEQMLVRYRVGNNIKGALKTLPGGEVIIEHRGRDSIVIDGKRIQLDRYSIEGVTWGRELLWFDSAKRLIAATGIGNDTDPGNIQAIREGYQSALPFFLKKTAEYGITELTELAKRLSPQRKGALAIVGGTLIDGTGKAPVADSTVVIKGNHIAAAGPRSQVKVPAGVTVVDARGKYVLPGLWDMHAHLFQVELGPVYLAAGVTTVRDVGNDIEFATAARDAIKRGLGLGPRMLLAGYISGKNPFHLFDVQVDTPEEARAAVRHYKNAGYEQIKIRQHFRLDTLKVITAEAHRLGMTVTGHVPETMNALDAVEAGMDQINHTHFLLSALLPKGSKPFSNISPINFESPEARRAIQLFKEHGTVIDPTLAIYELELHSVSTPIASFEPGFRKLPPGLAVQLNLKGTPAKEAAGARALLRQLISVVSALHKAGIPVVAGTDVGVAGHSLHRELELYVRAGFTPMEAIQAATIVPARAMKLDKQLGTVEAGKRADIIIVEGDPLESISNIRKITFVVTNGRIYDCARLWQSAGFQL